MSVNWEDLNLQQPVIGQLVRELRQSLKLTQEKFAAQLGVTFPTINRWENGHAIPSPLAQRQIHQMLKQLDNSPDAALRQQGAVLRAKYLQHLPNPQMSNL